MDYSSVHDVAAYLVAAMCSPDVSENRALGFRSDHISFRDVADLVRQYSGKKVTLKVMEWDEAVRVVQGLAPAPAEMQSGSRFPADFLVALHLTQGQGNFWRPPGQLHNHLFPQVRPLSFATYLSRLFGERT